MESVSCLLTPAVFLISLFCHASAAEMPAILQGYRLYESPTASELFLTDVEKDIISDITSNLSAEEMSVVRRRGTRGLINMLVEKLPELHLPGYRFCGPGTKFDGLKRFEKGINPLDEACKQHDLSYESGDPEDRRSADRLLKEKAWAIYRDRSVNSRERADAWLVAIAMRLKENFENFIKH